MNKYLSELKRLKTWDEIQFISPHPSGYQFITTAGHGYLVVPKDDKNAPKAIQADTGYGFKGKLAYYLEEDCEASNFINLISKKQMTREEFIELTGEDPEDILGPGYEDYLEPEGA